VRGIGHQPAHRIRSRAFGGDGDQLGGEVHRGDSRARLGGATNAALPVPQARSTTAVSRTGRTRSAAI
jgi:hypothetical protein